MLCGGTSAARPATEETQQMADEFLPPLYCFVRITAAARTLLEIRGTDKHCPEQVKPQLEEKEGKTFDVFTAVEFKTQVVAGTNYFIKVHVGNDEFVHLRVFRSLPHENKPLSLHSYQSSKAKQDELTFF